MNPTQLTLILACFLMPIENPTQSETASPVVNSYIKTLEAQHLLMKTVAAREYSKHASLEELHGNGHATWMEMRQQQLRSSVLQARAKSFGEFVAVSKTAAQQSKISTEDIVGRQRGTIWFTDLAVVFPENRTTTNYLLPLQNLLAQTDQLLVIKRKEIHERNETRKADQHPSVKRRATIQEKVLLAQEELLATRCSLLRQIAQHWNKTESQDRQTKRTKTDYGVPNLATFQTIKKQCETHGQLIDHMIKRESSRLLELEKLVSQNMASDSEVTVVANRIESLHERAKKHEVVLAILDKQIQATVDSETVKSNDTKRNFDLNLQFILAEAKGHRSTAKLEREMWKEVLIRLETIHAKLPGNSTFAKARTNEIAFYQWKVELSELQEQLAESRMSFCVIQKGAKPAAILAMPSTSVARVPNSDFMFASYVTEKLSDTSSWQSLAKINSEVTSPISFSGDLIERSPLGLPPLYFRDLDPSYRPVSLVDHRRPLRLTRDQGDNLWKLKRKMTPSILGTKHDYGTVYSPNRKSLPRFDQPYQNGIIRPEYRRYLTPGQVPWQFPGSPNNLRLKTFRF